MQKKLFLTLFLLIPSIAIAAGQEALENQTIDDSFDEGGSNSKWMLWKFVCGSKNTEMIKKWHSVVCVLENAISDLPEEEEYYEIKLNPETKKWEKKEQLGCS